jgi:hypothetical protein
MRLAVLLVFALATSAAGAQVTYKRYYEGLPDLEAVRPFAGQESAEAEKLRQLLSEGRSSACEPRAGQTAGAREICGSVAAEIRGLLGEMATGLPSGRFSGLWFAELEPGQGEALLAQYDTRDDQYGDRYAAFFAFQWRAERYRVTTASWFLEGSLHAVELFGPSGRRAAFVRVLSCTECCAWVYLVACDFVPEPDGAAYQFSYAIDADESWQWQIEYELPGKGHSIDARVETRLPDQAPSGPHLLQYFDVEDGEDEWWSFRCEGLRCKPELFEGKAPEWFAVAWNGARPL